MVGIDIDSTMVDIGAKHCLDLALNRVDHGIEDRIFDFTEGIGCDAVIITAASDSLDPINFAGAISRKTWNHCCRRSSANRIRPGATFL